MDVNKLPKWAQSRIKNAEDEVRRLDKVLRALQGAGPESTNTTVERMLPDLRSVPLEPGSTVRFRHADFSDGYIDVRVLDDGWVDVHAGTSMEIRPHTSNHLTMRVVDKFI